MTDETIPVPVTQEQQGALTQVNPAALLRMGTQRLDQLTAWKSQMETARQRAQEMAARAAEAYRAAPDFNTKEMELAQLGASIGGGQTPLLGWSEGMNKVAQLKRQLAERQWSRNAAAARLEAEQAQSELSHVDTRMANMLMGKNAQLTEINGQKGWTWVDPEDGTPRFIPMGLSSNPAVTVREIRQDVERQADALSEAFIRNSDGDKLKAAQAREQWVNDKMLRRLSEVNMADYAGYGAIKNQPAATLPTTVQGKPVVTPSGSVQTPAIDKPALEGRTISITEQEKVGVKQFETAQENAGKLAQASSAANTVLQLMNSPEWRKGGTGPLTPAIQAGLQGLGQIGVFPADSKITKGTASMDEVKTLLSQLKLTSLVAFRGAGQVSDADMKVLDDAVTSVSNTEDAIRMNMKMMQIAAQRSNEQVQFAQGIINQPMTTARNWQAQWLDHINKTPALAIDKNKNVVSVYDYLSAFQKKYPQATKEQALDAWRSEIDKRSKR